MNLIIILTILTILHNIAFSISEEHLLLLVLIIFFVVLVFFVQNILYTIYLDRQIEILKHQIKEEYIRQSLLNTLDETIDSLENDIIFDLTVAQVILTNEFIVKEVENYNISREITLNTKLARILSTIKTGGTAKFYNTKK
jgi:hypothetical protein